MNYETLQNEIITRLQPFTTVGVSVVRLPENNDELTRVVPKNAKLTVIYAGSEYGKTLSVGKIAQDEEIFMQILIESSSLYGSLGVYNLILLVKKALTGFSPSGCKPMQAVRNHTIGSPEAHRIESMWQYNVVFSTTGFHIDDFTEDLSNILKKITYVDIPDGETTIVPPEE